jgi:hypothetical protein
LIHGPIGLRAFARGAARAVPFGILLAVVCVGWDVGGARADDTQGTAPIEPPEEALFSIDSPIGPIEYRPARGLRVGRTGLNIGGFKTYEIEKEKGDDWTFAIDGINFLVLFQPVPPLRAFFELEVGDLIDVNLNTGDYESNPTANFQRLYGEFSAHDALNVRYGKFQTPIGRWNLVPAEPFTPTTIEPVLLESFDEHQTGPMLHGSFFPGSGTLRYWLYGQVEAFDPEPDEEPSDSSVGWRLEYSASQDTWSIGSSFLAAKLAGTWGYLGGLDARWRRGPFELSSEFIHTWGRLDNPLRWDVFLQGSLEVLPNLFLVGRYEHSEPTESLPNLEIGDVGISWTPRPYLVFKATYRFTDRLSEDVPEGFKASFSLVF